MCEFSNSMVTPLGIDPIWEKVSQIGLSHCILVGYLLSSRSTLIFARHLDSAQFQVVRNTPGCFLRATCPWALCHLYLFRLFASLAHDSGCKLFEEVDEKDGVENCSSTFHDSNKEEIDTPNKTKSLLFLADSQNYQINNEISDTKVYY